MSQDALKEFVKTINTDESLRAAFEERFSGGDAIPADQLITFARDRGYEFTVDDAKEELTDAELEGVSGGTIKYEYDASSPYLYTFDYDMEAGTFDYLKVTW
ncbi:MAG: Nif11-like leader peptide family RiPP precursor [Longimicrobiales bacterium]|nr:Nif11-like leader peptide family RiPP precursor [Longimicrobiales bacterium]